LNNRFFINNIFLTFYIISINFESYDPLNTGGFFSASKLVGILYVLSTFFNFKIFYSINYFNKKFIYPFAFLIFLLTLVSVFNINFLSDQIFDEAIILNFIIFIVISNHVILSSKFFEKSLIYFAIGSLSICLLLFFDIGKEINSIGRVTFLNSDLNELGLKLSLGLIIILNIISKKYKTHKFSSFILLITIPIFLSTIFETGSRSAIIFIILCLISWSGLYLYQNKIKLSNVFYIMFITSVSGFLIYYYLITTEILLERINTTIGGESFAFGGRLILWQEFSEMLSINPLFGLGLTGYQFYNIKILGSINNPHNVLLQLYLYTGVIGLITYLIFLYRIFKSAFLTFLKTKNILPIYLLLLIIVFNLGLSGLDEKICWVCLAYIVGKYISEVKISYI